jgi:hypothetical protein
VTTLTYLRIEPSGEDRRTREVLRALERVTHNVLHPFAPFEDELRARGDFARIVSDGATCEEALALARQMAQGSGR